MAKRVDRQEHLAGDAERLPAGREDAERRAPREERVGQRRHRLHQVLAVVDHEHEVAFADGVREPFLRRDGAGGGATQQP